MLNTPNNNTNPINNIPDVDSIINQINAQNNTFNVSDYFNQNVAPLLNDDVLKVLYGQPTSSPQPTQSNIPSSQATPIQSKANNYSYKTFYGGTPQSVNGVAMNSMGLKGKIWENNSVPYISDKNTDSLKYLDDYFSSKGIPIIYTSAMGGHTKGGHVKGNKVDLQSQGRVLTPQEYRELFNLGFFGGNTGAVGYEYGGKTSITSPEEYERLYKAGKVTMANGGHYDIHIGNKQNLIASGRLGKDNTTVAFTDTETPRPQGNLPIDQLLAEARKQDAQPKPSSMTQPSTNLLTNFINNAREIGTGLNYIWANAGDIAANAPKAVQDYFASGKTLDDAVIDVANMVLSTYNIDLRTLGDRDLGNIAKGIVAGAYAHPFDFLLDFISLGGAGVAKKLITKVPGLARVAKAGDVEKAIAAEQKAVTQNILKAQDKLDNVNKLAQKTGISTEELLRAAEQGGKSSLPKTAQTEKLWNALKETSDDFDELAHVYSPDTYVGKERTAIIQKIMRDRELTSPGITYEQVRREVTPYLDDIDSKGIEAVSKVADKNPVAREVYNAKKLFDDGEILPITHMMAEVDKTLGQGGVQAARAAGDLKLAGRFSSRAYGNATYKAIAEQWAKPQEYLTNLMDSYLEGGIASSILKGEFAPISEGVGKSAKASYLDRSLLEQGKLREALNKVRKEPLSLDDIAIDDDVLAPMKSQLQASGNGLTGFMKDVGGTVRGTMLSSLGYLGPNFITGATNAIMNSGPMIIGDIVSAIKSKGNLAKQLGVYRYPKKMKISNMPVLRQIDQINSWVGNKSSRIDRGIQNIFAEIAAHANLRAKGIPFYERFRAINEMDKMKLGEVIADTRKAALINSSRNILPDFANDIGAVANPFWKWTDTATQSTFRMLEKSPLMSNILLTDIMANVGFDKEMQNRMNLHVDMDKPYVSFKFDPKSNQMKTISAEFVPITTSVKFMDIADWGRERPAQWALFGPMINAMGGLDQYGKPMKRPSQNSIYTQVAGNKRFQSGQGMPWHEIQGQGDEILNTAIKQLIGPVNLYNKTIAPLMSSVISPTGQYYQPYGMSTVGGFDRDSLTANPIAAGNPTRGRTAMDVINSFRGIYQQNYNPEYDIMTPNRNRSLTRQFMRSQMKLQGEGY